MTELKAKIKRNANFKGLLKLLKLPFRCLREIFLTIRAEFYIYKIRKKAKQRALNSSKKIRVAFIVYAGEVWDKELPIYEAMLKSEDFEPFLVLIPNFDYLHRKLKTEYGDEKEYFEQFAHGENLIYFYKSNGEKVNLSAYNFDYVFYQTPYNNYFPPEVRSGKLVEYTKVCYIPYGYWGTINSFTDGFNRDFYRNLFFGFMEESENAKIIGKRFFLGKQHRIVSRGYPVFENIHISEKQETIHSILWTPRWTYSETVGGSHFFEYKDNFVSLKDEMPELKNVSLMIRPHQLAFDNFVASGLMTQDEVDQFKKSLKDKNITIDYNKSIMKAFQDVDLLLTDISSIIIPFFLTGKPLVVCDTHLFHILSKTYLYSQILENIYIAKDWGEVQKYIRELSLGNDYMYQNRKNLAIKMLREHVGSSDRILETIRLDYKNQL